MSHLLRSAKCIQLLDVKYERKCWCSKNNTSKEDLEVLKEKIIPTEPWEFSLVDRLHSHRKAKHLWPVCASGQYANWYSVHIPTEFLQTYYFWLKCLKCHLPGKNQWCFKYIHIRLIMRAKVLFHVSPIKKFSVSCSTIMCWVPIYKTWIRLKLTSKSRHTRKTNSLKMMSCA